MVFNCYFSKSHEGKMSSIGELHESPHSLALLSSLKITMAIFCGSVKNSAEAIAICICLIQIGNFFQRLNQMSEH